MWNCIRKFGKSHKKLKRAFPDKTSLQIYRCFYRERNKLQKKDKLTPDESTLLEILKAPYIYPNGQKLITNLESYKLQEKLKKIILTDGLDYDKFM